MPKSKSKLNITQRPNVGQTYVAQFKDAAGSDFTVRCATASSNDTKKEKGGELVGIQCSNLTDGGPLGEQYFVCKVGRKGYFKYILFFCSAHHTKCMGCEVTPNDIPNAIPSILMKASEFCARDAAGRIVFHDHIPGVLEYEWLELSVEAARAAGMKIFAWSKDQMWVETNAAGRFILSVEDKLALREKRKLRRQVDNLMKIAAEAGALKKRRKEIRAKTKAKIIAKALNMKERSLPRHEVKIYELPEESKT